MDGRRQSGRLPAEHLPRTKATCRARTGRLADVRSCPCRLSSATPLQVNHGDIQPANVIVTSHSSRLQLIDFGSAWTSDWTTRRTEGDGHHRCYAAPELQAGSIPVTLAGDQFSVSVLLFELLTQQLPYGGLGGKASRPEFIAHAADTSVSPNQFSARCQSYPGHCETDLMRWPVDQPGRPPSGSQCLAQRLAGAVRPVSHHTRTTANRKHADPGVRWTSSATRRVLSVAESVPQAAWQGQVLCNRSGVLPVALELPLH